MLQARWSGRLERHPRCTANEETEFLLEFSSRNAERGGQNLRATQLNSLVDAWDFLTRTPTELSEKCHPLKGDLATVVHNGEPRERWQLELSKGARIWYYVTPASDRKSAGTVHLLDVHTHHPNQTK